MIPKNPVAGRDATVSIKGKGNFSGEITNVPVIAKTKAEMKEYKISAKVKVSKAKIYNGQEQTLTESELTVKDGKGRVLKKDKDYTATYKKNINAGTAKVIVKGTGSYFGKVTKTFKIKPDTTFELGNITRADKGEVYCVPERATPELTVTKKDGTVLKADKDYTVRYYDNTRPRKDGKYKVTFIGNYKGRRQARGEFEISAAPFKNTEITVKDMVYLKAGKLKPEIFVTYEGVLLKENSDYTVKLYKGDEDITGKKVTFADSELPADIKVVAKGKKSFDIDTKEASFKVTALPEGAYNLTDAKIYAQSSNELLKKADYNGKEVKPPVDVKVKNGSSYEIVPPEYYSVTYLNNTARGKAKIIISGDNEKAFGSRTGSFTIGVKSFKDILAIVFGK